MAGVYADLIDKGLKTIDDVPASLRPAVQEILDSRKPTGTPVVPIRPGIHTPQQPEVDDDFLVDFDQQG